MFAALVDDFILPEHLDDTVGIQAAIDSVSDHTTVSYASLVQFTAGREYTVSSTIVIPYGVRVMAHGATITSMIDSSDPVIQWGDATRKAWVGSWHGGVIRTDIVNAATVGIKVEQANHGVLEDIRIGGFGIGIAIDGTDPVQWEVRRCFVSNSHVYGIRAYRANVLRILGGKIHCKDKPGAIGIRLESVASLTIDAVDISICEGGALSMYRCTGVDIRGLYTERCGGVAGNDQSVVSVTECYGFHISGSRLNAANGTVTGKNSLAWSLDIIDSDGGSVTGCMGNTARKGFARIRNSERIEFHGNTEDYFNQREVRIHHEQKEPASPELIPPNWINTITIVRGVTIDNDTVAFEGGTPDSIARMDIPVIFSAGETFQVNSVFDVIATSSGNEQVVESDMPVLLAWMQNKDDLADNNKSETYTLIPLRMDGVHEIRQEFTPVSNGKTIRINIGSREHWPGFTLRPRFMSLRRVV